MEIQSENRFFKILNYFFKTTILSEYLYSCETSVGRKFFQIKNENNTELNDENSYQDGCYYDAYSCSSIFNCIKHEYCKMMKDNKKYEDDLITSWLEEFIEKSSFNSLFKKHYEHNYKKIFSKVKGKFVKKNSYYDTILENNLETFIISIEIKNWKNDSYPNRNAMEMRFIYLLKLYRQFQVDFDYKDFIYNYENYEEFLDRKGDKLYNFAFVKNNLIESKNLINVERYNITDLYDYKYNSKFFAGTIEKKDIKKFIDDYNRFSDFNLLPIKFRISYNKGFLSNLLYKSYLTNYNYSNFLLIKPSSIKETILFENLILKLDDFKIKEIALFRELPDYIIGEMYEHCAARNYGKFWYNYLQSFVTIIVILDDFVNEQDFKNLRLKMLEHRDYAKTFFHIPWNRNGIHCPIDKKESEKNLETWLSFKNGSLIIKNFDNTPILTSEKLKLIQENIDNPF